MLSSLLGGGDQTALAGAIGKYAGLGQGASRQTDVGRKDLLSGICRT
jgi:hypothetical protein